MLNQNIKHRERVQHTLAFSKAAGGPAAIYISLRVLARLLVGKRRRDNIIQELHLGNFSAFLNLFRAHVWEPAVSSLLLNKHGHFFIDIGAKAGYYSFLLYKNFDTILAIEPHPRNFKEIQRVKVRRNCDKIRMLQIAVSDQNGEGKLYLGSKCGRNSLLNDFTDIDKSNYMKVHTATLDSLLKKDTSVDLIKVDVEGAEWKVLNGAKKVMGNIKSWLIELHDLTRRKELEDLLKSYGYNVRWVDWNHIFAWRSLMRN